MDEFIKYTSEDNNEGFILKQINTSGLEQGRLIRDLKGTFLNTIFNGAEEDGKQILVFQKNKAKKYL